MIPALATSARDSGADMKFRRLLGALAALAMSCGSAGAATYNLDPGLYFFDNPGLVSVSLTYTWQSDGTVANLSYAVSANANGFSLFGSFVISG